MKKRVYTRIVLDMSQLGIPVVDSDSFDYEGEWSLCEDGGGDGGGGGGGFGGGAGQSGGIGGGGGDGGGGDGGGGDGGGGDGGGGDGGGGDGGGGDGGGWGGLGGAMGWGGYGAGPGAAPGHSSDGGDGGGGGFGGEVSLARAYAAEISPPTAQYGLNFAAGVLQGAQQAFSLGLAGVDSMDRAGDPGFSEGAYAGTLGQQNSFTNSINDNRSILGGLRDAVFGYSRGDAEATNAAVESRAFAPSYSGQPSSDMSALGNQVSEGNVQSVNGKYSSDNVGLGLMALGYGYNLAKTIAAPTPANVASSIYGGYNVAQAANIANKLGAFGNYGWSNGPSDSEGPGGGASGESTGYADSSGSYNPGSYSPEAAYALASYGNPVTAYDNTPSLAMRRKAGQNVGYKVTSPKHSDPYAAFRS